MKPLKATNLDENFPLGREAMGRNRHYAHDVTVDFLSLHCECSLHSPNHPSSPKGSCQLTKAVHGGKSNTKTLTHALPWLAGSYPLDWMDFMESGIFGFLMKNWIDSAKKIRVSPKFAFRGQMDSSVT